jgi:RNA polymerase sigma factor (sigma-70 family)
MHRSAASGATRAELEAVYREHYPSFLRVATAVSGSTESGRDAVHDAFVSLIRSRKKFRRDGQLEAWAWTAVVNAARKQARRRSNLPLAEDYRARGTTPNGDGDPLGAVRAAISRLPERQRLALFLRYYADLDYATIAETLGTAPGTVAAALHTAHETLKKTLQEVETNA